MFNNIPKNQIIKNTLVPICADCIYFAKHRQNIELSKCLKYGAKNIVTGEIKYNDPYLNRAIASLCGNKGNYFVKKIEEEKNQKICKSLLVLNEN